MDLKQFEKSINLANINADEFLSILFSYFGQASFESLPGVYTFQKRDNLDIKLRLALNKNGNITSIGSEHISNEQFYEISKLVQENLIDNQDGKIGEAILFCVNSRITGYFKYKEIFQILPIPEDAPRISQLVGNHPFLLQYKYKSSPDHVIGNARRKYQETLIAKRLNLLTRGAIRYSPMWIEHEWVIDGTVESGLTSRYAQQGYIWNGYKGILEKFTDSNGLKPIALVNHDDYNDYRGFNTRKDDALLLPDNLSDAFDKIDHLSVADIAKFDRSCGWFYQSALTWLDSQSLSYIGLVTAIESLFENYEKCKDCGSPLQEALEKCETCGEPKYKIMKTLKKFLDKYVPFIEEMPKEKKMMYKTRSELAHGLGMFSRDAEPGVFLKPVEQEQHQLHRNIHYIVFTGISNWLWSR